MSFSIQAINDFKRLYLKHFHLELENEDVAILGMELLSFFKLIYRAVPKVDSYKVLTQVVPVYEIE